MRAAVAALLLLLLAASSTASLSLVETVSTSPSAKAPPITLGVGTAGTTTLGTSLTSASTTGATLPIIGNAQVLKLLRGASNYDARIELVGVTGTGVLDSITVSLVGASTQAQVVVTLGTVTQSTGTAVTVPAAGPDVQVIAAGGCLGTCTFTLRIILVPTGQTDPTLSYPYTLAVT